MSRKPGDGNLTNQERINIILLDAAGQSEENISALTDRSTQTIKNVKSEFPKSNSA